MIEYLGKMKKFWLFLCMMLYFQSLMCQLAKYPFPTQIKYTAGSIKVSRWSQSEITKIAADYYDKWKSVHIKNDCEDKALYYVFDNEKADGNQDANTVCVSEGQGYGMMIMAFMAGRESKAKMYFDGMYRFCRAHPSKNSPYLMSWSILKGCTVNKDNGNNTAATDGDLDIAFSLLLADAQWGSKGAVNYKTEALLMLDAIKKLEINTERQTIKLCDDFEINEKENNDIRSSDFMPDHLREFFRVTGDSTWLRVLNQMYSVFHDLQINYSPLTGLIPDFIQHTSGGYKPARPNYLESENDGQYYYNACRVPMRLTMDYLLFNDNRARQAIQKINGWLEKRSKNDPDAVLSGYRLNGSNIKDNDYTTLAFLAPFTVSLMADGESQGWLDDMYGSLITKKFSDYKYYDNTINLLCLLILSGNYWTPSYFESIR
jgi:endoglucanase